MKQTLGASEFKRFRRERGVSQAKIARDLELPRSQISLFENGRYLFGDADQQRLLDYLQEYEIVNEEPGEDVVPDCADVIACDGFLFPGRIDRAEIEAALAYVADDVAAIRFILGRVAPSGWLGGLDRDGLDQFEIAVATRAFSVLNRLYGLRGDPLIDAEAEEGSVAAALLANGATFLDVEPDTASSVA